VHERTWILQFSVDVQVGFMSNDGVSSYMVPWSQTSAVLSLAKTSNVGVKGRWMYRVDGKNIQLPNIVPLTGLMALLSSVYIALRTVTVLLYGTQVNVAKAIRRFTQRLLTSNFVNFETDQPIDS
jgi:Nidogen-like